MEKKVYEGYKRTSASGKSTSKQSAAPHNTTTAVKNSTSRKQVTKKTVAKPAGKSSAPKPRIAMFIDVDNVGISRENLLEILFYANGKYQIEICKLYGFNDDTMPGIRDIAGEYNVVTVGKMKFKQTGINCLDSRLLIDAYECALNNRQKIDMIFLWSYPCDLANLFEKIIALGINTATINDPIFDCKNKFVSQTFKLYSPYNFGSAQATYGKVQNEASNIAPSTNIEPTPVDTKPSSVAQSAPTNMPNPATDNHAGATQPAPIDGVIPPVLPRRSIPERSNPNAPKPPTENNSETTESKPTSLVEEIARKLNLAMPSEDEISAEMERLENAPNNDSDNAVFMDMLKQAGFDDLLGGKKSLKYEDTIGDL
ncbi:MAG: NYN domain-containing protein [Prevotella sp.]|nr:NYN domain-containing protein [Prevotella sp.]